MTCVHSRTPYEDTLLRNWLIRLFLARIWLAPVPAKQPRNDSAKSSMGCVLAYELAKADAVKYDQVSPYLVVRVYSELLGFVRVHRLRAGN